MSGRATVVQTTTQAEGSTFVNSMLSEVSRSPGITPTVTRAAFANRTKDGVVDLDGTTLRRPRTPIRSPWLAPVIWGWSTSRATTTD